MTRRLQQRLGKSGLLGWAAALFWLLAAAPVTAGEPASGLKILLISSVYQDLPFTKRIENGLDQALGYRAGRNSVYFEYLDSARFDVSSYGPLFARSLAAKYQAKNLDAVIVWGGAAARFLTNNWDVLKPRRVIGGELAPAALAPLQALDPTVQAVLSIEDYEPALRTAVEVGQARRVILVGESFGDSGKARQRDLRAGWRSPPDRVALDDLFDMPLDQTIDRVRQAPSGSIVYYTPIFRNEHGANIRPVDALSRIAAASPVAVFSQWDTFIGPNGAAGGLALSGERLGRTAGRMAAALVAGDMAAVNELSHASPYELIFDAGRLARWSVPESRLPLGARVINRPPGMWEQHRDFVIAGGAALAGMALVSLFLWRVAASRQRVVAELAAERETLAQKVADRTADLNAKADELARSNAELESFAYAVSHDLRAPLRTMRSYVGQLLITARDKLDADELECADFIHTGAERLDGMIHGLLEYCRAGRLSDEQIGPVRLQDAIADVLDALDLPHIAPEVQLSVNVPNAVGLVVGDRHNIERLIQNLIDNALKYRHPERAPVIDIALTSLGSEVVLSVRDNGLGIPPDQQERVFGLFQRLQTGPAGYGVGLALCRRIAETCGGRLWVESTPGEGCVFYAAFPAVDGAPRNVAVSQLIDSPLRRVAPDGAKLPSGFTRQS